MSLADARLQPILTGLSSLICLLGLGGGIQSLVSPESFAEQTMGLPTNSAALPFISFAGARNLSSGLTMLTLLYTGQRKAVGTLLMCGVVAGMTDAWISAKYNAAKGKAVGHAVMASVLGALGGALYWTQL
ncbi:MAG: hypothetical protein Q9225_001440 [Loekoesia sp. 1 TL-2023]